MSSLRKHVGEETVTEASIDLRAGGEEVLAAVKLGESRQIGPYQVTLDNVSEIPGPNWSALDAKLTVKRGDGEPFTMHPQSRTFTTPPMETNEAAISTSWDGQLYLVVAAPTNNAGIPLRMWWKPFVTFIWLGGIMIALGGLLALLGRVNRDLFRFPSRQNQLKDVIG